MSGSLKQILFGLFFVSGFCGLLYQIIWVRLAFASFGIITPVLSVVISVFMAGLAAGSWLGGKLIAPLTRKAGISAIVFYGLTEALIGLGAFVVPELFKLGEMILLRAGESDSLSYLFFSATAIAVSIFPWCFFMGTTFPFMMAFVKEVEESNTTSFSFLYLANVIGAMAGTLATTVALVELFGFQQSLWIAGSANWIVAGASFGLARYSPSRPISRVMFRSELRTGLVSDQKNHFIHALLFTTGFASLALEVVWTRAFTPVMGTQIYAFGLLLFIYLLSTWLGSLLYRRHAAHGRPWPTSRILGLLAVSAFLPIVINDPRFVVGASMSSDPRISPLSLPVFPVLASIVPLCALLGYLTPSLIDQGSRGNPRGAGKAYAVNVIGCILGPLAASYLLLPAVGARFSMVILGLPFLLFYLLAGRSIRTGYGWVTATVAALCLVSSLFFNVSYEDLRARSGRSVVRRDHTATVISEGHGMKKRLWVNGVGITILTPITKFMAHLPLAFHKGQPESALVICFGMGTTFRSLMSWDVETTGVELVPSVKAAFGYYFDDAEALLKSPKARIVVDDGRRFLRRTLQHYDVITLDPPPPHESAGSSLLYSEEFYALTKSRLKPGGILQQWFTFGEENTAQAVVRSLTREFPYVKVYPSIEGWGHHFLASMSPLPSLTAEEFIQRLPRPAWMDLLEWNSKEEIKAYLDQALSQEIPVAALMDENPGIRITDDHPFNEYFWLRRIF